jgi:hypothetical protein
MNTSRVADEEGFEVKFLKHDIQSLDGYITDVFNHVVYFRFPLSWSHDSICYFSSYEILWIYYYNDECSIYREHMVTIHERMCPLDNQ